MIGGQTKTPTISVLFERRPTIIGGAGVVAEHLRAAGAKVVFSTVLGEDALKDFVLDDLRQVGRRVPTPSSTRRGRRRTRMRSSPAAIVCSRSTRSTTVRSPTRSLHHIRQADCRAEGRGAWCSAISVTACSTAGRFRADRCDPRRNVQGRRQPGGEPLGQYHRIPRFRSDHAERARGALRAGRSGFRHPAAGGGHLRRRRSARR